DRGAAKGEARAVRRAGAGGLGVIPALLRRASELVPVLKESAAAAEQPRRDGGADADLDAIHEVAFELGRGCGSTAWCYSLWATHNWWLGHFPEQAQDEFFATGPDTLFSSGLHPAGGKSEPVSSGLRVARRRG